MKFEEIDWSREVYKPRGFIDRFLDERLGVDVIIPIIHSNGLWRENLLSIYREIPVQSLIVGDAGCIDGSIEILKEFPRVKVINQTAIKTLGSCLADLFNHISTEHFIYIHSDVYLPEHWFDEMYSLSEEYQWIGSPMQILVLVDYKNNLIGRRPLAGAQLGKSSVFKDFKLHIEDDFIYRQEDFVLNAFVSKKGYKVGNAMNTYHVHEVMKRTTKGEANRILDVEVHLQKSPNEIKRIAESQIFGLIKYCSPTDSMTLNAFKGELRATINNDRKELRNIYEFILVNNIDWRKQMLTIVVAFIKEDIWQSAKLLKNLVGTNLRAMKLFYQMTSVIFRNTIKISEK